MVGKPFLKLACMQPAHAALVVFHETGFRQDERSRAETYKRHLRRGSQTQVAHRLRVDRLLLPEQPANDDDVAEVGRIDETRSRNDLHAATGSDGVPRACQHLPVREHTPGSIEFVARQTKRVDKKRKSRQRERAPKDKSYAQLRRIAHPVSLSFLRARLRFRAHVEVAIGASIHNFPVSSIGPVPAHAAPNDWV